MIELASRQAPGSVLLPSDKQRVIDGIQAQIRAGKLKPREQLPTIVQLAQEYGTGQTTVKSALDVLHATGWVRGQQGKGNFVADEPPV